jgi:GNAT superfamily N-acetyltransferase
MSRLELRPFADEHLDDAAQLLAARHAGHREAEPLLGNQDPRAAVEKEWQRGGTSGAVALRDGRIAGYLIGTVHDHELWQRHVYADRASHAAEDTELLRDVYAYAADRWVQEGALMHLALAPATASSLDPWQRLGFGQMQVGAIRESGSAGIEAAGGVTVRQGGLDDLDGVVAEQFALIWDVQRETPVFTGFDPPSWEVWRPEWEETLEDPTVSFFVAERDGRAVGHSVLYPPDPRFGTPDDAVWLGSSAVIPHERGSGVGLALTAHALEWARDAGFGSVVTDWRVTNLFASRFWPARGFRPTFHRLARITGIG